MRRCELGTLMLLVAALGCSQPATRAGKSSPQPSAARTGPAAQVLVIGGGLAGLVTAYELEKRGITVELVEASDTLGGRVQTARYGEGLDAEFGMQEMWEGNPLLEIARELKVPLDPEPQPAYSSVIIDGELHPFVQKTVEEYFASFLSRGERSAFAAWMHTAEQIHAMARREGLAAPKIRELQEMSFATWLQRARLPRKVTELIKLTLACELGTSWDQFSALDGLLELDLFFGTGKPNYHVQGGNSRLIEALAAAIRAPKRLSTTAVRVRRERGEEGRVRVQVDVLHDDVLETLTAERAVLAVPFVRLHQITFEPPLETRRWDAVTSLGFGQYTVVHFLISKEAEKLWQVAGVSPFPVLTDGPLGVIYGVQHPSPASQPLEVFGLLVYGVPARLFHMAPRELKIQQLEEELDRMWPGFSRQVRAAYVHGYHPAAIAVWPPGRSPIDERSALMRTPDLGVYFAGDYTRGSHSSDAAQSGVEVATQLASELGPPRR